MKKTAFTFLMLICVFICNAQEVAVDSRGEPVFLFYSKEDARLQLNRRAPVSASYLFHAKTAGTNKFSGTVLQLSMLNSGDFPLIAKLKDIRPGAGIKLGYQKSVEYFSKMDEATKGGSSAWSVHALFSFDNIKLYDTVKQAAGKRYPLTYGVEGNYVLFFKNKTSGNKWRKALALYASLSGTWNDRNLLSYREVSGISFRPDVIALQDFDGRYGVLRKNFLKYRMAASFPMFYGKINPVPYLVAIFGTQNSPSYHMGMFTNIMSVSLNDSDKKMPGSFGLGFDWVYATERLSSKVNLFVKASISLGKL